MGIVAALVLLNPAEFAVQYYPAGGSEMQDFHNARGSEMQDFHNAGRCEMQDFL